MSPLEQLGLPPDADERMVKRAYAQRLRGTRPDTDAEGFQRLHAVYQAALVQCQRRVTATIAGVEPALAPTPRPSPSVEPPAPTQAQPPAQPPGADPVVVQRTPPAPTAIPLDHFLAELMGLATHGDAARVKSWLEAQPALWSLRLKVRVGHELFVRLYREAPPMPPECLEALLAFFDMNHARSGHDPLNLQRLQRRMQLAWELLPQHRDALARRLVMRGREGWRKLERNLARLSRPFHWPRTALIGVLPNAAANLARFILQLSMRHPEDLPAICDQRQIRFWLEVGDRHRVSRARLQLGGIRCLAALLGGLLLGLLAGVLLRQPPDRFVYGALEMCLGLAAVPCVLWAVWMALLPLDAWHGRPEHLPVRWPWLNLLLVPLLCAAVFALREADVFHGLTFIPALLALWLALRRLWRRNATMPLRFSPRLILMGVWIASAVISCVLQATGQASSLFDYSALVVAAAMLAWGIDLWCQRRGLRVRRRQIQQLRPE
jgi:hypothetical protein